MNHNSNYYLHKEWKLTKLGLLIFPLLPTLGILTLVFAAISTFVKKWHTIIRRPQNIALASLALWLAIATFFAWKPQEAFLGLANLLPFFGVFAAFSTLIQTPAQLRQLSWIVVISSVPVVILGFGQLFFGWSGLLSLQIILGWVLAPQGNPPGRMASVFMYANILAIYLTVVFILGLGLWIEKWKYFQEFHRVKTTRASRLKLSVENLTPQPPSYPPLPSFERGERKGENNSPTTEGNLVSEASFVRNLGPINIFWSKSGRAFCFFNNCNHC